MDMRNNTAGIRAFAGATLFTLSGTYHGYSLFRNFKSIGGALPGSPKAIPLSIRNLCYCVSPKDLPAALVISTDTKDFHLGI